MWPLCWWWWLWGAQVLIGGGGQSPLGDAERCCWWPGGAQRGFRKVLQPICWWMKWAAPCIAIAPTSHSYFWALACFLSMERQRIQWGKMIRLLENVHIRKDGLMAMRMSIEQPILISVTLQVIQLHKQFNNKRTERDLPQFRDTSSETGWMAWNYLFIGGIKGPWSTLQM